MRLLLVIAISIARPHSARAEIDTTHVALEDLIDAAVRRSPGLAMAHADHEEARDRDVAASAVDAWHVIGRVTAQDSAVDRALAGPGVALDTRQVTGQVGVQRSLSTGAAVEAAVVLGSVTYLYQGLVLAQGTSSQDVTVSGTLATARVVASQPLVRGRGSDVARADQRVTRFDARAESARGDDEAAGAIRELATAYWELAYATEQLAVDRDGEALAIRQLAVTQDVVKLGFQAPSASKVAELQLALRREAILRDRTAIADQSLLVRRLAGLELDAAPIVPSDAPDVARADWRESDAIGAALAHGPGLVGHAFARKSADVAVDVAENGTLPRLDATLTAELSGVGAQAGDAFSRVGSAQMYTVIGGLTLQWDLGGAAAAAEAGAHAHRTRLDAEKKQLEDELTAATMSAVRRLRAARQRIEVSQLATEVAGEALRAELVAFSSGRSTNVIVFQREDDVAQAKLRLARARIDVAIAWIQLDYLTGTLLDKHHVRHA